MSESPQTASWSLPPDFAERVDQICNAFEAALKAGAAPQIEEYVADVAGPERALVFRELLALELEYVLQTADRPHLKEYLRRFPRQADLVQEVCSRCWLSKDGRGLRTWKRFNERWPAPALDRRHPSLIHTRLSRRRRPLHYQSKGSG